MEKFSQEAVNSAFLDRLQTKEGQEEIQEKSLLYIKRVLREESFARKILPPRPVTKFETQRAVDSDSIVKIVDLEPKSLAQAVNFRSEAPGNYVSSSRYAVPFFTVTTPMHEKQEQELYAYESPLVKIIEENSVKDIQESEDQMFLRYCNAAVAQTSKTINAPAEPKLTKELLIDLFKLIENDRLSTSTILMSSPTAQDILGFPVSDVGSPVASKTIVDGYTYNVLMGKKLIVTTKTQTSDLSASIIPYGEVWAFTEPHTLGNFFILGSTKFYIDKIANLIRWKTWEDIGMGIGNARAIARLRFGTAAA